ncbi:uncharacterized protein TNCT_237771 [Trichonephila clavata]|uniref:Uncharacterized protein n=1 Tax=Trichonephila clavata TaxID=2740835 RepID=A0A8X6LEP1_TRICU|nr:uncharacterized protein TNCT_237771 [Trichonephila clavata]
MIETFPRTKLNQFLGDHEEAKIWFQQDGATAHTSRRSLGILRELFPGRLLLRGGIAWPPKGSHLIFSLGTFKCASVQTSSYNPGSTKEVITYTVAAIPLEMTRRLWTTFEKDFVNVSPLIINKKDKCFK